jgi:hypothetical protein
MRTRRLCCLALIGVASCALFDYESHRIDGPYELVAVDELTRMSLAYDIGDGASVDRVPATVFAAGANAKHVIAKRHPGGDRSQTEWYILVRAQDSPTADASASVIGPLTEAQFAAERDRLGVTRSLKFTVVLGNLQ